MEDIHPALESLYGALLVGGLICLVRDLFIKPKIHSLRPDIVLDPWKIKGLDMALIFTFTWLLMMGAVGISEMFYQLIFDTEKKIEQQLLFAGFSMHIATLVSLYGFYRYFNLVEDVPLNPVNYGFLALVGKSLYYFLAIIPILIGVSLIWPSVLEFFKLSTDYQELVKLVQAMPLSGTFFMITFLIVILAPLAEELLFRACLYRGLKRYMSPTISAIITSLLFAGMHFNAHSFLPLFVLGFWLCRTYEKTGNLWVPIILHGLFNGNTLVTLMLLGE
jgi:membrane protease YdiL (CAAX protease family)